MCIAFGSDEVPSDLSGDRNRQMLELEARLMRAEE